MAYCHEPHNGERWDMPTWNPQTFKDAVRALHDTGLQICVHCAGDAATDLTLDAFEEAMNGNPRPDPRHRIEHAVITKPESTQRMRELGVVVSTQPQFIRLGGDGYADLFGEERARRAIVTREWLDAGVTVALGSDSPSTPWYTPQVTLFGAVTRVTFSNQRVVDWYIGRLVGDYRLPNIPIYQFPNIPAYRDDVSRRGDRPPERGHVSPPAPGAGPVDIGPGQRTTGTRGVYLPLVLKDHE